MPFRLSSRRDLQLQLLVFLVVIPEGNLLLRLLLLLLLLVFLVVIPEGNLLLLLLLPVLLAVIPAANPLSRTPTTLHEST